MSRLAEVRTMVVGGGSGIGRALVQAALDEGARVAVIDRDPDTLGQLPTGALGHAADATDPRAVQKATDDLVGRLGGLDALVHTAGVHDGFAELESYGLDALTGAASELLAVNLTSAMLCVRAALPALRLSSAPSVTLTSSESGFGGRGGGALYCASKWGVRGLVAALATELAPQVRVNGVAPGGTTGTRLRGVGERSVVGEREGRDEAISAGTKLGVLIHPEDVAAAYCYLIAPRQARAVTGTIVNVDGGRNTL